MHHFSANKILKRDFLNIKEDNVMFITNPGRMGDEDGITFVVKNDNILQIYRVDGWYFGNKNNEEYISLSDALLTFPKWEETWKKWADCNYNGKYKYLYMGFGNGLSIDKTIYDLYKPFLDDAIKIFMNENQFSDEEKTKLQYVSIFNVWDIALINMANANGFIINETNK